MQTFTEIIDIPINKEITEEDKIKMLLVLKQIEIKEIKEKL